MQFFLTLFVIATTLSLSLQRAINTEVHATVNDSIPKGMMGQFEDDYGIKYEISDTLWLQKPNTKFHILRWNTKEQYIIARNGDKNPGDPGFYSRIDYMTFANMQPWGWGFCLTAFNANTDSIAEATTAADRKNPRKGCNGFPFSRMKKMTE